MSENPNNPLTNGLNFPQKSNIIVDTNPTYYGVLKNDWKYLKDLISDCNPPFSWVEIIVSAFISVGVSFIISVHTIDSCPLTFHILGYCCTIIGILGVVICIYLKRIKRREIDEVKKFFNHIDETLVGK